MVSNKTFSTTVVDLYKQAPIGPEPKWIGTIVASEFGMYTLNDSAYSRDKWMRVELRDDDRKDLYITYEDYTQLMKLRGSYDKVIADIMTEVQ